MRRIASAFILTAATGIVFWLGTAERPVVPHGVVSRPVPKDSGDGNTMKLPAALSARGGELPLRPDVLWREAVPEPEFADFRAWVAAPRPVPEADPDGVRLAKERRAAMKDLISRDPRRALELAVPESVRRSLPPAILAELETPVSGRGDLMVAAAVALPGREHEVPPVFRTVKLDGVEYAAFTYGHRESAMSREGLVVHGIVLDGQMALSEWPARVLEPVEAREARARLSSPPLCPVSGAVLDENGDEGPSYRHTF